MPKEEAAKRRVTKESAMRLTPSLRSPNTVAKSKVRENQFKNVCDYFDILGLGPDLLTALFLLQRHTHLQDEIQSIEGHAARVEVAGDKLRNS